MKSRRGFIRDGLCLGATAVATSVAGKPRMVAGAVNSALKVGLVLPYRSAPAVTVGSSEAIAADLARRGAELASEELDGLRGRRLDLLVAAAPTPDAAHRTARRLVATENVCALIGGFEHQAEALQEVAMRDDVLFFNIGDSRASLRVAGCRHNTFHVEASAAMYVDATAAFFTRLGQARWFLISVADAEGRALVRHTRAVLEQHGGEAVGHTTVDPVRPDFAGALRGVKVCRPTLVVMLLPWLAQLDFLQSYERAGLVAPVTGFPAAVAQTREFMATARERAPRAGSGMRLALWEPTLTAAGAGALNQRFHQRWGQSMDAPAWAGYQAVAILSTAARTTGSVLPDRLRAHLTRPGTTLDVQKSTAASFHPRDRQLRQSLYAIKVNADSDRRAELAAVQREIPYAAGMRELRDDRTVPIGCGTFEPKQTDDQYDHRDHRLN